VSINVCIADDHLLMLTGIREALEKAPEIKVVAVTQRGDEVLAMVAEHQPDLVLLDHRMPGMDGIECLKLIRRDHPRVKVVMLSASEESPQIATALAEGASAYIGKRINPSDLASALRQIVAGVVYQNAAAAPAGPAALGAPDSQVELTQRELIMLQAISRGLSTKAISTELWVSEKTVKFHLTNVYRKLGVHNRTGAMRYAYEHDLLPAAADHGRAEASA
jgi:DNA-binding NarL/FixJ family response regulator